MILISFLLFFYTSAAPSKCTAWKQGNMDSLCTHNGVSMRMWYRTCLSTEDKEEMCWSENPETIKGDCSEWVQIRERCLLKQGGFGDKWTRMCKTQNDKREVCLEIDPNTL